MDPLAPIFGAFVIRVSRGKSDLDPLAPIFVGAIPIESPRKSSSSSS